MDLGALQPPLGHLAASSMPPQCLLQVDFLWALNLAFVKLNQSYLGISTLHGGAQLYFLTFPHLVAASHAPLVQLLIYGFVELFLLIYCFFIVFLRQASPRSPLDTLLLTSKLHDAV
jgi:hypothetical protein